MKVYLIYNKTAKCFVDKRPFSDGRKYLIYGDIRSARMMANNVKKYGVGMNPVLHRNDDIVVLEYEANIEHMKEV